MSSIFELPLQSETLSPDEVHDISGCARKSEQLDWLSRNGWIYVQNKAGAPIIGRLYARMRLAGINPAALLNGNSSTAWDMDLSKIK